ncbi:MAG TPA: TetR-like C-terminal domain-containing protein [Mycobacteriales bacterium]|nr:TetR-like C-terminal domain-containing protein [Mycobacteriales bacterium]
MRKDGGRRGRPRDGSRDAAIRAAVLELLAETGYTALTVDAVAVRARAGKATIYRRWPGKAELVVSAVAELDTHRPAVPDTGRLRDDLVGYLSALAEALRGPLGAVTTAVVGAFADNPELAAALRGGLWGRVDGAIAAILRRAVTGGEVPADAPLDLVRELAGAALVNRLVLTGEPIHDDFVRALVDQAMLPLLHGQPKR